MLFPFLENMLFPFQLKPIQIFDLELNQNHVSAWSSINWQGKEKGSNIGIFII